MDTDILKNIYDIYGSRIYNESNIINIKDILYNKDKFESRQINLCFVTGHSGSGKSTLSRNMTSKDIEHYEIDDVLQNWNFSDDNLKEYGDLIYSFFKGPGKKFRCNNIKDAYKISDYDKNIIIEFVNYSISYSSKHKNIQYVVDGVQLFQWFDPNKFKNYAVYIKGTSRLISAYRASKRDAKYDSKTTLDTINIFKSRLKYDLKYGKDFEFRLNKWRKYFDNIKEEY